MTITSENDNDVIVYGLEKIISFRRERQNLFAAHCVWWIASLIGLDSGLVIYIDNLQNRQPAISTQELSNNDSISKPAFTQESTLNILPSQVNWINTGSEEYIVSTTSDSEQRTSSVSEQAETFIRESERLGSILSLKATG